MWFRKILAVLTLAVLASGGLQAQSLGAQSILPWNGYLAQRIPNGYTTIIGQAGTELIPNSPNATGTAVFNLQRANGTVVNLPFPFRFLGTTPGAPILYPTGYAIKIGASGYISFNGSTGTGSATPNLTYNTSTASPANNRTINPYWSDVEPRNVSEGGIYWRVDGTAAAQNRVLTIEWRVQGIASPTRNPGQFQAKLFEGSNKIEFFYSPNSINRSTDIGTAGAFVGLRMYGYQTDYNSASSGDPNDIRKFLILLHPDQVRDTVALTRTRAVTASDAFVGTQFRPEVTATWQTSVEDPSGFFVTQQTYIISPYFHYSFPTLNGSRIGYRITSVADDAATDSVYFTPTRTANAYTQGSSVTINAIFRNTGTNARQNIPVVADVYRNGVLIATRTGTAFTTSTNSLGTSTVTFQPPLGPPETNSYGTYTVKVYIDRSAPSGFTGDQDVSNDTLTSVFYISYPHDVMADSVIAPRTFTPNSPLQYPVGLGIVVEGRFVNIGTSTETDVRVGYSICDAAGNTVHTDTSGVVRGSWEPLEYREVSFAPWTPTTTGEYYVRIFTMLPTDQQRTNDTFPRITPPCGKQFSVRYLIEIEAEPATTPGTSPSISVAYPDGRPIDVRVGFTNNGIVDATRVPVTVQIRRGSHTGPIVYNRSGSLLSVPASDADPKFMELPDFIPNGSGQYCVTAFAVDPDDQVRSNDTLRYCFNVNPRYCGTYYVGTGEQFRTIQEAHDSVYRYGVSCPVTFLLVDDSYTVRPSNNDATLPALDGRGDVVGLGPNNPIIWRPAPGKTDVRIILKSPSGIGIMYGQRDTLNPNGYITWDGTAGRVFHFVLDTAGNATPPNRAIPFFFSQGSSNYTVKNSRISPATEALGRKTATSLSLPVYNLTFNSISFTRDIDLALSTGILLRNSTPADGQGNNPQINGRFRDTLRNQNNVFDNNVIQDFGYGIVSLGMGALRRTLNPINNLYEEYNNRNNRFTNNMITEVTRGGIVVAYEDSSLISNNDIDEVDNQQATVPHAAGIWVTDGGFSGTFANRNRAYSKNLLIERNEISNVATLNGNGVGIWVQTAENVFSSPTRVYRFPQPVTGPNAGTNPAAATNHRVWNNSAHTYIGQGSGPAVGGGRSMGIAFTISDSTRINFTTAGNRVENNTLYNRISGVIQEYGIQMQRSGGSVRNNIIALVSPAGTTNPIGVVYQLPNYQQNIVSDYNLFWIPNGFIGSLSRVDRDSGFAIPTTPTARTLNQWRQLTGLDMNSVEGDITPEFQNTTPGQENLRIRPGTTGSLANNRGVRIPGLTNDVDGEPRGAAGSLAGYDIGFDEFVGNIRNNDVMAEDILSPAGYRPTSGQFADAEYVMADSVINLIARFRNVGGLPQNSNRTRMTIERETLPGSNTWTAVNGSNGVERTTSFDVSRSRDINYGTFEPQTLDELGQTDPFFASMDENVTPRYRFRITSGTDDFSGNNSFEKIVRFYVLRSDRKALVAIENYEDPAATPLNQVVLGNKLNADTLLAALDSINWERADGVGLEDYDRFERDKWPVQSLDYTPWRLIIWAQGEEAQGLEPEERAALKRHLDAGNQFARNNLIIAGQEVARRHDIQLSAVNGQVADRDFVRNYLRAQYIRNTTPALYDSTPGQTDFRLIRGNAITPGKFERIQRTRFIGDVGPNPAVVRPTSGQGIARTSHNYVSEQITSPDSGAGVATAGPRSNVVFYAFDWRHAGRFAFEYARSGAPRLLLGALDFIGPYQGGVVPVEMLSFDAYQAGRQSVRIDWETASEKDVTALEVERAEVTRTEQGVRYGVYTFVGRKTPVGTTTTGAKYNLVDDKVTIGSEYSYRLISVEQDGSRNEADATLVKVLGTEMGAISLAVQPNPARSRTTISYRLPNDEKVRIELFDVNGELVQVLEEGITSGSNIELDVDGLASGVYTVRLTTASGVLTEKLTVQK